MTIYDYARRLRRDLAASEVQAEAQMLEAWGQAWLSMKRGLSQLKGIEVRAREDLALLADDDPRVIRARKELQNALWRQERYRDLMAQVEAEMQGLASAATETITSEQARGVLKGIADADALMQFAIGTPATEDAMAAAQVLHTWNRANTDALTNLVGFMADGSPLSAVLQSAAGEAVQGMRNALVTGLVKGFNPRKIASRVRAQYGVSLTRALTISRTETLRAYREASVAEYAANDDVVKGWRWDAHLGPRTCAACIAMHGTVHPLSEPFGSHPNCRCSPDPITKTWEELGFSDGHEPNPGPTGEEWFADQPINVQRDVLGAKYGAYADGQIALSDVVGYRNDPTWGPERWERSAKSLGIASPAHVEPPVAPTPKAPPIGHFATLDDATAWARATYPHITFDFTGAHIDTINPTLAQFHRLAGEWPEAVRGMRSVVCVERPGAYAEVGSGKMALNRKFYGDPTAFAASIRADHARGWLVPSEVAQVLTHEFGHHVLDDPLKVMHHSAYESILRRIQRFAPPSRVATINARERFAEMFTAAYHAEETVPDIARIRQAIFALPRDTGSIE